MTGCCSEYPAVIRSHRRRRSSPPRLENILSGRSAHSASPWDGYDETMANIEISNEVLDRIEAEAARRHVTLSDVVTELADSLPPVRSENGRTAPAFVAAGKSGGGITDKIDELLADGFGRN